MKLKYIMASFLIGSCTFISSCKDDFADINTNPTIVSKPDPRYLFTLIPQHYYKIFFLST